MKKARILQREQTGEMIAGEAAAAGFKVIGDELGDLQVRTVHPRAFSIEHWSPL